MTAFEDDAHDNRLPYNQTRPGGGASGSAAEAFTAAGFRETDPAIWTRGAVVIRCCIPFMGEGEFQVWTPGGPTFVGFRANTTCEALAIADALDNVESVAAMAVQHMADELARVMKWRDRYNPLARFSEADREAIRAEGRRMAAQMLQAIVRCDVLKAEG